MDASMRIENAEERIARLEGQVSLWRAEHDRQAERELHLRTELSDLLAENRRIAERQAAAEQRVGQLAQLQAAALQLHEALLPADVLTVIKEIVANLIGSEEMGIYARRPGGGLTLLDGIGVDANRPPEDGSAVVSIPLQMNGQVVGLIAIFRLLPQKSGIEPIDRELFALLSRHAALALHHAELYASAGHTGTDA
jgi:hypothetical protein